jgi:hypothetical protein
LAQRRTSQSIKNLLLYISRGRFGRGCRLSLDLAGQQPLRRLIAKRALEQQGVGRG